MNDRDPIIKNDRKLPIDVPVYDFVEPTPIESTTRGDVVIAILFTAAVFVIVLVVML